MEHLTDKIIDTAKHTFSTLIQKHPNETLYAFKQQVHQCMTDALKSMDKEGFFGQRRADLMLYISSSDYDESLAMEDKSAQYLNPADKYQAFLKRYG